MYFFSSVSDAVCFFLQDSRKGGPFSQLRGRLIIPAVRRSHAGLYTCRLTVTIDEQPYKVSRSIALIVRGG